MTLIGDDRSPELSPQSNADCLGGTVTVNVRAEGAPEVLADCVRRSLDKTGERPATHCEIKKIRPFPPDRPVPRYRMAFAIGQAGQSSLDIRPDRVND